MTRRLGRVSHMMGWCVRRAGRLPGVAAGQVARETFLQARQPVWLHLACTTTTPWANTWLDRLSTRDVCRFSLHNAYRSNIRFQNEFRCNVAKLSFYIQISYMFPRTLTQILCSPQKKPLFSPQALRSHSPQAGDDLFLIM